MTERAALVTGAAKRIGRAIALRLASSGHSVALHCNRSRAEALALAEAITARGGTAAVVEADLADAAALPGLVAEASRALGPLTLLVNSASQFEEDSFGSLDAETWDRQLAVNLRAPVFLAQAFAAQVPEGAPHPSIVNLIDQRVLRPRPDFVSYYLAKSALRTATETMAQALAPRIRVNAVAPGPTFRNHLQSDDVFAREAAATPLGRGSTGEDIAAAVLYLATSPAITGQMIAVDGGQHLAWTE